MKISECMVELQKLQDEHGDLEVVRLNGCYVEYEPEFKVEHIDESGDVAGIWHPISGDDDKGEKAVVL